MNSLPYLDRFTDFFRIIEKKTAIFVFDWNPSKLHPILIGDPQPISFHRELGNEQN